ncbi:hypothetical protein [Micromonospora tulbaghiae]|uniref:hypothetical protein n=1 Tax=Micromonospora tulbaghiae TaxID=479978 RepID=UPI0034000130
MTETMTERLRRASALMRKRDDKFLSAVADWLDEEAGELEYGDPEHLHESALRAADLYTGAVGQ